MRYNETFGFEFKIFNDKSNESRICSPFARRFTPVKNSSFASLIIRLILTFKIYITQYKYELNDDLFDFNNLINNITLTIELLELFHTISDDELSIIKQVLIDNIDVNYIKELFNKFYISANNEIKNKILLKYLFEVNKNYIKNTQKQINLSFQDIIYNNYNQLQVGYTGTIYMNLNKYDEKDKYVFRSKIEDVDEMIEVKLALVGYGNDNHNNKINIIKMDDTDIDSKLLEIVKILKGNLSHKNIPRGFVDLAGLFLNYENIFIAQKLKNILNKMNIVYLSADHKGIEYDEININKKYKEFDKDNFYYYDQTHVVGSDLKQPRDGHVLIIINSKTRMTDFSQAIFRFRKLNRGTYLSVLLLDDTREYDNLKLYYDNPDDKNLNLYELLKSNEEKFNMNQIIGLEYQLLKTLVRKNENNYIEDNLLPEYILGIKYNTETTLIHIKDNIIHNLNDYLDNSEYSKINKLYSNLSSLEYSDLKSLIFGSGKEIVTQKQQQQEEQQEEQQELIIRKNIDEFDKYFMSSNRIINHLNCNCCNTYNCVKFFYNNDILINNKQIYISFNLLQKLYTNLNNQYNEISNDNKNNRFCFVEFNDKILIELEIVSIDYYIYKLPVYSSNGKLIIPHMFNTNNKINPTILDIDDRFVKIIGIKKYINPNKKSIKYSLEEIKFALDNINPIAFIILSYLICVMQYKYRYNPLLELQDKINKTDFTKPVFYEINSQIKHNTNINDNLLNVSFEYIFDIPLKLNSEGYEIDPPRILLEYQRFHNDYNFDMPNIISSIKSINNFIRINISDKNKYLKYKKKYIKLKEQLNNMK